MLPDHKETDSNTVRVVSPPPSHWIDTGRLCPRPSGKRRDGKGSGQTVKLKEGERYRERGSTSL